MKQSLIRDFATGLTKDLFTNGNQQVADRLVLELPGGGDGGGLCRESVRNTIMVHVEGTLLQLIAADNPDAIDDPQFTQEPL